MRIISLKAENVKRLRAVEITPEGDTVIIAGRNAQGKSSVLDAIWMALAGAAGTKETTRPIRDGEKQASVELDLGDLLVTRKWTEAGTTLQVAAADGARYPSPQTVLDGLIGRLTFDPLAFAEQDAKGQLATLLSVVELPFDPSEVARKRAEVYEIRTEVNREIKRLEALLSEMEPPPKDTPDEEVSAANLAAKLETVLNQAQERDLLGERMTEQEAKIAGLRESLTIAEQMLTDTRTRHLALGAPADPEPLRAELAAVDKTNTAVRAKKERAATEESLATARVRSEGFSGDLEQMDAAKAEALASAKMPLDGLSFDEEGVLYQGIPFAQVSDSERLRVSIAIAMALNPKIRVIRITDGSLLDSENLALISEMATEHDFQIWIEKVDETGTIGITIEDGAVA